MKNSGFKDKTLFFKLAKFFTGILLSADIILISVTLYSFRGKFSFSGSISPENIARVSAVLGIAVLLIITEVVLTKKEAKYAEERKLFYLKLKYETEREQERLKRESAPPAIDLDKALEKVHPDLKNLVITNRNIDGCVPQANSSHTYIGTEPSLIDEYLPANLDIDASKEFVRKLPPSLSGLSYSLITPNQRGMYIKFLEEPYKKNVDIGYVIIFFFGLERQLVYGDNGGSAADVMSELRRIHSEQPFINLSFNALVYFCRQNNTFLEFLKSNYYNLNLDFTMYYLVQTEKAFPSEAMIRFKKYFNFPENAADVNPVLLKDELDRLLGSTGLYRDKDKKTAYSLEKYIRSGSVPQLMNLPFPSNRSMNKLYVDYSRPRHLYDMEPFKSDISDLLRRAYMNVVKNYHDFPV